jgi:hypothetical protein
MQTIHPISRISAAAWCRGAFVFLSMAAAPGFAFAQADEIQVYDAGIADKGVFNLTWHNNFTPNGVKTPSFPGGVTPDKSLNGVPEWAYGVTDWFEAGLYMPLYTVDKNRGAMIDGSKLRLLFVSPHADDRTFVFGMNFEFSYNSRHWDAKRFTSEIRPIIGWHLKPLDIIVNPIIDTSYEGLDDLIFAPATRVAYNFPDGWAAAVEEYADFGSVRKFAAANDQSHQLYAVVDKTSKFLDVEFGVGFGLTDASDRLTLKLILSRDLNAKRSTPAASRLKSASRSPR